MMTVEMILAQLDRIHETDGYYTVDGSRIYLTLCDFEGFDQQWDEIFRDWTDETVVDEVLAWLDETADLVRDDFYHYYHFGDIVVEVGYTSFDI